MRADEAMLAGLLHNIGKVYIIARAPKATDAAPGLDEAVVQDWYPNIGQSVAENWKLPVEIASAIAGQRDLDRSHNGPADLQDLLIVAVHMAAQMANKSAEDAALAQLPAATVLGLDAAAFGRITLEAKAQLEMLRAALG